MNNNNNENLESELQPANKSQYGSKLKTQNKTKIEAQNPVTKEKNENDGFDLLRQEQEPWRLKSQPVRPFCLVCLNKKKKEQFI